NIPGVHRVRRGARNLTMTADRPTLERPRSSLGAGLLRAPVLALLCLMAACGGGGSKGPAAPPAKKFPVPVFDGLWLGMTRDEAAGDHAIRPALTAVGKTRAVWVYDRAGVYGADLTFASGSSDARLERVDVHLGKDDGATRQVLQDLDRRLGEPDVRRRKAVTNAYGDRSHDEFDTIWSDATQYVSLTERVPVLGKTAPSVFYISIKRKELVPPGPPTGYVPPPPPKGKDGKPVEESPF